MGYQPDAGDAVLLRGIVTSDCKTVLVGPGIELPIGSVVIETDIPKVGSVDEEGKPAAFLLLVFGSDEDRQGFVSTFEGWPNVQTRDLG